MKTTLEQTFEDNSLGVCLKNTAGKVLQQNRLCHEICGNQTGEVCKVACMELYAKDKSQQWQDWGSRIYNNSFVQNAFYDITLLCSDEHLITFLQPLKEKYKVALNHYKNLDFTRRERQITAFMIQGASNSEICNTLSISKATLKTHLNNIYKKVNDRGVELKYIPKKRLSFYNAKEQYRPGQVK